MNKLLKVTLEYDDCTMFISGAEVEKYERHMNAVVMLAHAHGCNPYDYDPLKWEILNGEIRESCKKLCPDCNAPYITYTSDEYYECNSCGYTWT